jgi:hypothetical protein
MGKYGDCSVGFMWQNKEALAAATMLTAFRPILNPLLTVRSR